MRGSFDNIEGKKFNRLTVIKYLGHSKWLCKCDCGNHTIVAASRLKNGTTKSCGCLQLEFVKKGAHRIHGLSKSKLSYVLGNMIERCYNPKNNRYKHYGARGIRVCDEWLNNHKSFYDWALANGYHEGLSIDRIDNDKDYSPENCRFVDNTVQMNNRSDNHYLTYQGKTMTISQWEKEIGIPRSTIQARINKLHWSIDKALTYPVRKRG